MGNKNLAILGSTGSIGTQTIEVVRAYPEFKVKAIAAGTNVDKIEAQVREFHPELAVMYNEDAAKELRERIADTDTRVASGMEGLIEAATLPEVDMVETAVVGMIGIRPTMAAIEAGKDIALANKETLVTAGHLIMKLAKEHGVHIYPVDSEHSAIHQSLKNENPDRISRILLTASGGPFRGRTLAQMEDIRPEDALKHPNWAMGRKITIDSSTMVNKGLEVMEAKWLFGVSYDQVEVVVQPESIIHSMVEFVDGGIIAQLGAPDMKLPIQYALFEDHRMPLAGKRLDFSRLLNIHCESPDMVNFPGLALAYEVGRKGGSMPTVYNAANEWAVAQFLDRRIGYLDIVRNVEAAVRHADFVEDPDLDTILEVEKDTIHFLKER